MKQPKKRKRRAGGKGARANVVKGAFGHLGASKTATSRPIATKLVRKMTGYLARKVVDLTAVAAGKANAEALQQTVAGLDSLADHHPAHAIYVYAQNQASVMSEQLTGLREMDRFVTLISRAEETYLPSGPPMSPLTTSFFTCWAMFDACVGLNKETLGTTILTIGASFGMAEELLQIISLMQDSRMGVYVYQGEDKDAVVLRELITDRVCTAISPSGYRGKEGELWYVRVLPPPVADYTHHVVFGTPYALASTNESEWQAYFSRTLPDAPNEARVARYQQHMKFGPTRDYWTEYVFEAYANHRADVIYLMGLPDIAASRPHSSAYQG